MVQIEYEVAKTTRKALLRVASYESKKHQLLDQTNLEGLTDVLLAQNSVN